MQFDLWIPGKPHPKERVRVTKGGQAYTPRRSVAAEQDVLLAYMAAGGPEFSGAIGLDLEFTHEGTQISIWDEEWQSPLRGDLDNYIKTMLDGLQGAAFKNDRAVVKLDARKS